MQRALAVAVPVLVILLAGCAAPLPEAALDDASDAALAPVAALLADVPCEATVSDDVRATSENLLPLASLPTETEIGEMDVRDHVALIYESSPGGLLVVDVADPLAPKVLSSIEIEGRPVDVKWTPAGDGAYVGTTADLVLVDLTDLAAPRQAFKLDVPKQAHSLATRDFDGVEYVYAAGQTAPDGTFVVKRTGWELELLGQYRTLDLLSTPIGHHDPIVVEDEIVGAPLLYVSQGFEGWTVADLADPAAPRKIGGSLPEPGAYTHMLRVAFIEGKRIVVTQSEVGLNAMYVYDATDLSAPKVLARWNVDAARPQVPQHNLQIVGDHLYLVHYTEGLFVFDLTDIVSRAGAAPLLDVEPVAHLAVADPTPPDRLGFSDFLDLQVDDGVLWVTEIEGALHSVGFGCITPGDVLASARQ